MTEPCGCRITVTFQTQTDSEGTRVVMHADEGAQTLMEYCPLHDAAPELLKALKGLLRIAKLALPDTYFHSDRRVKAARRAIAKAERRQT